jgi:DNA primase
MREQVLALLERHLPSAMRAGAGGNVLTKCPFHKGGQETKPSFSVNVEKGLFHCFTCHIAGDVKYLLRLLGLSRSQIDAEVASIQPELDENRRRLEFEKEHVFEGGEDPFKAKRTLPEELLGVYDFCPNSLLEAGFMKELLQDMEIGFDRVLQRVTYPIRDMYGNLAGIAGGRTMETQQPKYLVYQGGRREMNTNRWIPGDFGPLFDEEYPGFQCENHDFIWNFHKVFTRALEAVSEEDSTVYVVEGYKACLWMLQHGYHNTVALMGSYISDKQQMMLAHLGGTIVLMLDNDEAGRRATKKIGKLLWRPLYGRLKVARYPDDDVQASINGQSDSQPDDYVADGVHWIVANSYPFHSYMMQR